MNAKRFVTLTLILITLLVCGSSAIGSTINGALLYTHEMSGADFYWNAY